jgi:aminopeptidase-like protein
VTGKEIHDLAKRLWPINRSLTGDGVRETLQILREVCVPDMQVHEIPSGTQVYDWTVPKEWRVREAYIVGPDGKKICDFKKNNLHLLGYSIPIKQKMDLEALDSHLYSLPEQPDAVPYVTSYYKERWGFCLSDKERSSLKPGLYRVHIDSDLFKGSLTYGEAYLQGLSDREIFISTYVCHPSMANNELSGPCVSSYLYKWLRELPERKYSYRFVFIPETIGSIVYLSKNFDRIHEKIVAGFNVTCIGDNRAYSYLPSRQGNTLSDKVARHVLSHIDPDYISYSWETRGSDERQYCAPGVDLPIASIMRSKYGEYPEYHTSLDNLKDVVTPQGLGGGYEALRRAIEAIERNVVPRVTVLCEPQLGKRGLYPTISQKGSGNIVRLMMNLITWSDGTRSLLDIAEKCKVPIWDLYPIVERLAKHDLLQLGEPNDLPTRYDDSSRIQM